MVRWLIGATVLACGAAAFAGDAPERPKVITNEDLPPLPGGSVPGPLRVAQDWRLDLKIPDDVLRQLDGDAQVEARREAAAEAARVRREESAPEESPYVVNWGFSTPWFGGFPVGRFRSAVCLNGVCPDGRLPYDFRRNRPRPTPAPAPTRPQAGPGTQPQPPQPGPGVQSPQPQAPPKTPSLPPRQQAAPPAGGSASPGGR